MAKEEYLLRISMLEQEAKKLEEQIQLVGQQIQEFEILKNSLEKIAREEKEEMLAPLGRGIFFKAKLLEKELFVNIGKNVVLRKSPKEAGEIIDKQVRNLEELRGNLLTEIEKINLQLQALIEEARKGGGGN